MENPIKCFERGNSQRKICFKGSLSNEHIKDIWYRCYKKVKTIGFMDSDTLALLATNLVNEKEPNNQHLISDTFKSYFNKDIDSCFGVNNMERISFDEFRNVFDPLYQEWGTPESKWEYNSKNKLIKG